MRKTIFLVSFLFFYSCNNPYDDYKFDSKEWKEGKVITQGYTTRFGMVEDLRKNYLKEGLSKDSVITLLGEPSKQIKNSWGFEYSLGFPINRVDPELLIIMFNEKGIKRTYTERR